MTNLIEQQHQATLTSVAEEMHVHTFMVKVAFKATGLSKRMTAAQASSSNRSVQVDTNYTSTLPLHAVTGSEGLMESAIDYTIPGLMLYSVKLMEGLYSICGDIT